MNKAALVVIGIVSAGLAHAGGIYRCVDPATGKTVFSQFHCGTQQQPVDVDIHQPTPEEVEEHNALIQSERAALDSEQSRRYDRWLSGKYRGGDHTYTDSYSYKASGYSQYHPPVHVYKETSRPSQPETTRPRGSATMSGGR